MLLSSSADFFQNLTFSKKILQEHYQSVCKGYLKMTKVPTSKGKVNKNVYCGCSHRCFQRTAQQILSLTNNDIYELKKRKLPRARNI